MVFQGGTGMCSVVTWLVCDADIDSVGQEPEGEAVIISQNTKGSLQLQLYFVILKVL